MEESFEKPDSIPQKKSSPASEGLNSTEKEIAKILMGSKLYDTLSPSERLKLVKLLEEKYPELSKVLDSEHFDA